MSIPGRDTGAEREACRPGWHKVDQHRRRIVTFDETLFARRATGAWWAMPAPHARYAATSAPCKPSVRSTGKRARLPQARIALVCCQGTGSGAACAHHPPSTTRSPPRRNEPALYGLARRVLTKPPMLAAAP